MKSAATDDSPAPETRLSAADRAALKALSTPSDAAGLSRLAGHLALIGVLAAAVWALHEAGGWAAALPGQLALGIALVFLFAPLHETIHRTAFRSRWLNDALAHAAGAVLILPPRHFRAFHLAHHRFTQIPGQDPELPGKEIASRRDYLRHISGLPYWGAAISGLLKRAAGRAEAPYLNARAARSMVWEARGYLAFYLATAGLSAAAGSAALVTYWLIPVLLGQPFLRLYLLAEHKGCEMTPDMFRNTRTTLTAAPVRWLAWNMPYHTAHHAFMAVPFHRLAEAHRRFEGRIAVIASGYAAFHRDYVQGLR
jgi:fatty acid desaturase